MRITFVIWLQLLCFAKHNLYLYCYWSKLLFHSSKSKSFVCWGPLRNWNYFLAQNLFSSTHPRHNLLGRLLWSMLTITHSLEFHWEAFQMPLEQSKALWITGTKRDLSICHGTTGRARSKCTHGAPRTAGTPRSNTSTHHTQTPKEQRDQQPSPAGSGVTPCTPCPSSAALPPVEQQQVHARHKIHHKCSLIRFLASTRPSL